jgi:hypothetical protein
MRMFRVINAFRLGLLGTSGRGGEPVEIKFVRVLSIYQLDNQIQEGAD